MESLHRVVIAPVPEILFIYVTGQVESDLILEAVSCSFSWWVTWVLYNWNLKSSCRILWRDLLKILKATASTSWALWTLLHHCCHLFCVLWCATKTCSTNRRTYSLHYHRHWNRQPTLKWPYIKDFCHALEHQTHVENVSASAQLS